MPACWPMRSNSAQTCCASSRVGASTRPGTPLMAASTRGMPKAAVLPVPVCAWPMASLPARSVGTMAAWMGEASSKPMSERARRTGSLRLKESNLTMRMQFLDRRFPRRPYTRRTRGTKTRGPVRSSWSGGRRWTSYISPCLRWAWCPAPSRFRWGLRPLSPPRQTTGPREPPNQRRGFGDSEIRGWWGGAPATRAGAQHGRAHSSVGHAGRVPARGPLRLALHVLQGEERGVLHEGLDLRAGEALRVPGQRLQAHVVAQRPAARVDVEDLQARLLLGHAHLHDAVEAAGPQEGGVQQVGAVRRREHRHAVQRLDAVHLVEEAAHDALRDLAVRAAAARGDDAVDLVEEEDRGRRLAGLAEHLAHRALALAHPLAEELRPLHRDEVGLGLGGDGLREQRLPGAGRAVEQHAAGRLRAQVAEEQAVLEGPLDGL